MDNNEAIKELNEIIEDRKSYLVGDYDKSFEKHIQALEYAIKELERTALEVPAQEESDRALEEYLSNFKKYVYPKAAKDFLDIEVIDIGNKIIKILKEEELTYVNSYATLEYVYKSLKVMSEYTHL